MIFTKSPQFHPSTLYTLFAMFRRIGQGFCGTVWAAETGTGSSDTTAIKREDGGPGRSLYNDYIMHKMILSSFSSIKPCKYLRIPACHQYVSNQDPLWEELIERFPSNLVPCNSLITERIPPFPQDVRDRLIDKYCPDQLKASIISSEPDRDCLIRPYLGRRRLPPRTTGRPKFQAFSLRNYPLHLDQLEELSLDCIFYARIMAEVLANLYWKAKIDANDIEFVLAPQIEHSESIHSLFLGDHVVWILDFDCCRSMTMDVKGVEQAVVAFYKNDPFFPRPCREIKDEKDQGLWTAFRIQFLETSKDILEQENSLDVSLPALWVELVEKRAR